jgi:hypothetical protein
MNKFQPVQFKNIDSFLDYLPDNELQIVARLREIVLDIIPDVQEKLAYNVPYYYRFSRICFIWPSSVPWGSAEIKGVQFGFCNGNQLEDSIQYLQKGNRKQVYWKEFNKVQEIDAFLLQSYIIDAIKVDEMMYRKK